MMPHLPPENDSLKRWSKENPHLVTLFQPFQCVKAGPLPSKDPTEPKTEDQDGELHPRGLGQLLQKWETLFRPWARGQPYPLHWLLCTLSSAGHLVQSCAGQSGRLGIRGCPEGWKTGRSEGKKGRRWGGVSKPSLLFQDMVTPVPARGSCWKSIPPSLSLAEWGLRDGGSDRKQPHTP